jgi:hypothetical protein
MKKQQAAAAAPARPWLRRAAGPLVYYSRSSSTEIHGSAPVHAHACNARSSLISHAAAGRRTPCMPNTEETAPASGFSAAPCMQPTRRSLGLAPPLIIMHTYYIRRYAAIMSAGARARRRPPRREPPPVPAPMNHIGGPAAIRGCTA